MPLKQFIRQDDPPTSPLTSSSIKIVSSFPPGVKPPNQPHSNEGFYKMDPVDFFFASSPNARKPSKTHFCPSLTGCFEISKLLRSYTWPTIILHRCVIVINSIELPGLNTNWCLRSSPTGHFFLREWCWFAPHDEPSIEFIWLCCYQLNCDRFTPFLGS